MTPLPKRRFRTAALLSGCLFLACGFPAGAQESLVGFGAAYHNGAVHTGASPIGATIAGTHNGTGINTLTFALTGAFAGATTADFAVDVTPDSVNSGDRSFTAQVSSVTADLLTVKIRSADLEDATFPDIGVAADAHFLFLVRRIGILPNGAPFPTRHLIAVGNIDNNGSLDSGFGVGGVSIFCGRGGTGSYFFQLQKPGAFATDAGAQYVLLLSSRSIGAADISLRGGSFNATSNDFVQFNVHSDEQQAAAASNAAVPADASFSFAVYRVLTDDAIGTPHSNLLAAAVSVDAAGTLVRGRTSFPNATITSSLVQTGLYRIFIDSPGAFAGASAERFVPIVGLNTSSLLPVDDLAKANVVVVSADRLRINVAVDDVQHPNDGDGIPVNEAFWVTLYDAAPVLRHDLSIGLKGSGIGAKGAGVFNATAAGQFVNLGLPGRARRAAFFRSAHSGPSIDDLKLRSLGGSRRIDARYYVTTGTRRDVTAAARTGTTVEDKLFPGETISIEASFRYRNLKKRPRANFLLRTFSGYQPANLDTNRVSVRKR